MGIIRETSCVVLDYFDFETIDKPFHLLGAAIAIDFKWFLLRFL